MNFDTQSLGFEARPTRDAAEELINTFAAFDRRTERYLAQAGLELVEARYLYWSCFAKVESTY